MREFANPQGLVEGIVHAKIAQPRHVRYLSRDALARTLEE
jgi:hypothetical protein